jgi:hypothetical protein
MNLEFLMIFASHRRPLWVTSRHFTSVCSTGGYATLISRSLPFRATVSVWPEADVEELQLSIDTGRVGAKIIVDKTARLSIMAAG